MCLWSCKSQKTQGVAGGVRGVSGSSRGRISDKPLSGGSKGAALAMRAPRAQILSISCSFWENLTKSYVGTHLRRVGAPTSGKSWIRHCHWWHIRYTTDTYQVCHWHISHTPLRWRVTKVKFFAPSYFLFVRRSECILDIFQYIWFFVMFTEALF